MIRQLVSLSQYEIIEEQHLVCPAIRVLYYVKHFIIVAKTVFIIYCKVFLKNKVWSLQTLYLWCTKKQICR